MCSWKCFYWKYLWSVCDISGWPWVLKRQCWLQWKRVRHGPNEHGLCWRVCSSFLKIYKHTVYFTTIILCVDSCNTYSKSDTYSITKCPPRYVTLQFGIAQFQVSHVKLMSSVRIQSSLLMCTHCSYGCTVYRFVERQSRLILHIVNWNRTKLISVS